MSIVADIQTPQRSKAKRETEKTWLESPVPLVEEKAAREDNKLKLQDRAGHDWYRFILSYPPHLVRDYAQKFGLAPGAHVLDPFCGTGTTLVECKKLGFSSEGTEPNPVAWFASQTKVSWKVDPDELLSHARAVAQTASERIEADGFAESDGLPLFVTEGKKTSSLRTLPDDAWKLLLNGSISPLPLHKTLVLLEVLDEMRDERFADHERLALAKALVNASASAWNSAAPGPGTQRPCIAVGQSAGTSQ